MKSTVDTHRLLYRLAISSLRGKLCLSLRCSDGTKPPCRAVYWRSITLRGNAERNGAWASRSTRPLSFRRKRRSTRASAKLGSLIVAHDEDTKWHWQEGNKYAVEGIKTLLLLNGGAAVALLTFAASLKGPSGAPLIGAALICFGLGALIGSCVFVCAYLTQLHYGNKDWTKAGRLHTITYVLIAVSALAFLAGLFFAWRNLPI